MSGAQAERGHASAIPGGQQRGGRSWELKPSLSKLGPPLPFPFGCGFQGAMPGSLLMLTIKRGSQAPWVKGSGHWTRRPPDGACPLAGGVICSEPSPPAPPGLSFSSKASPAPGSKDCVSQCARQPLPLLGLSPNICSKETSRGLRRFSQVTAQR